MNIILYVTIFLMGLIIGYGVNLGLNEKINKKNTLICGALIGILFMIYAFSIKLNKETIASNVSYLFAIGIIYIIAVLIISIIDKKKREVNKKMLLFGFIIAAIYDIYLYSQQRTGLISNNLVYLLITCVLLIVNIAIERRKGKPNYTIDILILSMFMVTFVGEEIYLLTATLSLLTIAFSLVLNKIAKRDRKHVKIEKQKKIDVPIAYYLGLSNIVIILMVNLLRKLRYIIKKRRNNK